MGVTSVQLLAACAPAAFAPSAAPDAAGSDSAPAATDVVLRVQVPPEGGQSVMPTIMAQRYQDESGVEVIIEETIYTEIETKTQTGFISKRRCRICSTAITAGFSSTTSRASVDELMASDPLPDYEDIYPSVMAGTCWTAKLQHPRRECIRVATLPSTTTRRCSKRRACRCRRSAGRCRSGKSVCCLA
ncbi:MAG: hypothetical protein R2873_22780 [Caldilineaceae bacterium]